VADVPAMVAGGPAAALMVPRPADAPEVARQSGPA
jgi:hypothetical protein